MYDEKDVDTSNEHIDMPPLEHYEQEQAEPVDADTNGLPPELRQAQEMERQGVQQEQPAQVQQPIEQPVVSAKEKESNLRILREAAERAVRERDDMARRLQEYENLKVESPDEDFNIKEEDLVEGKHLAKAMKRIKLLEQQQKQYMKQSSETTAEMKLRHQYPDFDKVMTLENIQMLAATYPEIAESFNASQDLYKKAVSAYSAIKGFGIYADKPHETDKKKVVANAAKPRPLASVSPQQGESPLSRANAFSEGLTEARKEELRKEMDHWASMY